MNHNRLSIALTVVILLTVVYNGMAAFNVFHVSTLPFAIRDMNARTGVVVPTSGVALPEGLHPGNRVNFAE